MKLFIIATLILLSACSKNTQDNKNNVISQNPKVTMTVLNLTSSIIFDSTRENSQTEAQIIDFGSVRENSSNIHKIYLKNNYNQSMALNIEDITNALLGSPYQILFM